MAETIIEITAPVEFEIVGDRLRFTLVSGAKRKNFSISFHMAQGAAHVALRMVERALAEPRVRQLRERAH